jgi:uracil-DNA glycosylase family 4
MPKKIDIDEFTDTGSSTTVERSSDVVVPNKFPTLTGFPYRIAFIGEAPGKNEELALEPFVGMSGQLLSALMGKADIVRESCFVGNVCQLRPPNNDIELFNRNGPEITAGLRQLKEDLLRFQPHLCVLLGKTALWAALGDDKIGNWRGSLFKGQHWFDGWKCLASYHPAAVLRQYEYRPILAMDLKKAYKEGHYSDIRLPMRRFDTKLEPQRLIEKLCNVRKARLPVAIDIEGGIGTMSCISIATSASYAFIVPFAKLDGTSYYEDCDTEIKVWKALVALLEDPLVPKILQNSLYDRFVLQYSYRVVVQGVTNDTMCKFHEAYCELEKSLGFQASVLTNQPYYKSDRKTDDQDTFYRYCCMDSAVTYEINQELEKLLDEGQKEHYRFNVSVENPLLFMEQHGILYDSKLARERLKEVNSAVYTLQYELDQLAGYGLDVTKDRKVLEAEVRGICCFKRDHTSPKKEYQENFDKIIRIVRDGDLNKEQISYINTTLGLSLNIKGAMLKSYLYDTLKLPVQVHKDTGQPSTDYLSLLKLSKKSDHPAIRLAIEIGSLRTRSQMLAIHSDPDGRVRCGYNCVGTETGRLTCYTSPTGSGYNLQTIPADDHIYPVDHPLYKGMRDLFIADPGYTMVQCDLRGSDGWTIGAHLNALGDSTMLDDLRFGIKPAARICYMLRHGNSSLHGKQRAEVKELLKEVTKESWDYFASKVGIWGISYLMGPDLLANQILEESNGKIALSRSDIKNFHSAVFDGYHVKLWHDAMQRKLAKKPVIECCGGFRRRFFGRREEILGKALAHEPQFNTTLSTNKAAMKLWRDPENRVGTKLRCQPLHQIHDALLVQCPDEILDWTLVKLKYWFDNVLTIAGQQITIPFSCEVGKNWGSMKEP